MKHNGLRWVLALSFMTAAIQAHSYTETNNTDLSPYGITTYMDAPYADYVRLSLRDSLTAGVAGDVSPPPYSAEMYGSVSILSNNIPHRFPTSRGGALRVAGSLDVESPGGSSLLHINGLTDRMGVGTSSPLASLDVRGEVKAVNLFAYRNPAVDVSGNGPNGREEPQVSMFVDNTGPSTVQYGKFDTTYTYYGPLPGTGKKRYATLYIDGDPLVLQTQFKGDAVVFEADGLGQVVIKGRQGGFNALAPDKLILVVGEPHIQGNPGDGRNFGGDNQGDYPAALESGIASAGWVTSSSREWKKDIEPLAVTEYAAISESLALLRPSYYRYYGDAETRRKRLGFIAEELPAQLTNDGKNSFSLLNSVGFLLAAAKETQKEQADLTERMRRLRS